MNNQSIKNRENEQIELLAPAGNIEAGYAALHYGADAVYLGLSSFSARASAVNFSIEELADIAGYAHSLKKRRKIYAAVNTLILQNELGDLIDLLAAIADVGVDAVIVQDLGVLNILRRYFPQLKAHASTQMAIHNLYGVEAAQKMGIARVTLARELTFEEVAEIAAKSEIETEVFIHGALCYSYSGLCLFSSHLYGRSGNRGKCAYPCREWFRVGDKVAKRPLIPTSQRGGMTWQKGRAAASRRAFFSESDGLWQAEALHSIEQKEGFIFSMKDLALPDYIAELQRIGVTALKIEGRMKSPLYVAATTNYYRQLIDNQLSPDKARELAADVKTIFSRPWTDLYIGARRKCDVVDTKTQGHRGCPAGKAEEIVKYPGGHCLRFTTTLPIELHDGLQIDIAGQPRPFGFAVKNINLIESGRPPRKTRVFTASAGARVEIQLPRDHPAIPLGAIVYSSSSQKVKQHYTFYQPKLGQFRLRQTVDFDVEINSNGFEVVAAANVLTGMKGEEVRVEARKHFDGLFQQAKNVSQITTAIEKAFGKLGGTNLKLGKLAINNLHNLFVPISLLNSIRRDISAALEREIAEVPRKYAAVIKAELLSELADAEHGKTGLKLDKTHKQAYADSQNYKWSIKTDQPHLLSMFGPDDWRNIDEIIIECVSDISPSFARKSCGLPRGESAVAPKELWQDKMASLASPFARIASADKSQGFTKIPRGLPRGASPVFIEQLNRLAAAVGKSHLRLALPIIIRQWERESFVWTLSDLISKGWGKWQISNLGGWSFLRAFEKGGAELDISSDWPVYVTNRVAVLQLKALGISKFTLSPEDGLENMRAILNEYAPNAAVVVYQDTPLMISETCIFARENCSYPSACGAPWTKVRDASIFGGTRRSFMRRPGNFREMIFSSSHGVKINVVNRSCRLVVLNNRPFCLAAHLDELANIGAASLRADFMYRQYSDQETLDIWRRLRSGAQFSRGHPANFFRGLE